MEASRRLATVSLIATAALLAVAPAAGAAKPVRGTFDDTRSFVDTEVCAAAPWGFDVSVPIEHEYGFVEEFSDRRGNVVRSVFHTNYDATISANGKTIHERDTWTSFFYPDGSSRDAGLTVHIQGPGGIVQLDAGQIVYNAAGDVLYTHGPHPQLSGETFCPALAP